MDVAAIDAALAEVAMTRPHAELRQVVGHYLARLDPDGEEPDPTESRSLVTSRDAQRRGHRPVRPGRGRRGEAARRGRVDRAGLPPAGDLRTRAQRQADALVQLADNALAPGTCRRCAPSSRTSPCIIDLDDLADPAPAPAPGAPASAR